MSEYLLTYPLFDYGKVFRILLPVLCFLVVVGLVGAFGRATNVPEKLQAFLQVVMIVALAANLEGVVGTGKTVVTRIVEQDLKARPELVPVKFVERVLAARDPKKNKSFLSFFTSVLKDFFDGFLVGIIALMAVVSLSVMFLAYLAQELALEVGIALSPLFLGFLLLPSTRPIGAQFLMHMLALVLIPLGWGLASLVSDNIIAIISVDPKTAVSAGGIFKELFSALLLSVWIVLSTVAAPVAMMKMVTSGVTLGRDGVRAGLKVVAATAKAAVG